MSKHTVAYMLDSLRGLLTSLSIGTLCFQCLCVCVYAYATPLHAEIPATSFYSNLGDLAFKSQHDKTFNIAQLNQKITLFNFIYTQCSTVCPVQTKALSEVLDALPAKVKSHVVFVSVSLDPLHDTPQKLKAFAARMHAEDNHWAFITGNPADIATLSERLKLFGTDPKKLTQAVRPNDHTTHLWLMDKQGRLMMRYMGNPVDKARIAQDIIQLNSM